MDTIHSVYFGVCEVAVIAIVTWDGPRRLIRIDIIQCRSDS